MFYESPSEHLYMNIHFPISLSVPWLQRGQCHQPSFLRAHSAHCAHTAVSGVNEMVSAFKEARVGEEGLPGSVTLTEQGSLKQGQARGPQDASCHCDPAANMPSGRL